MDSMTTHAEFTPRQRLWAPGELLLAGAIIVGANIYDVVPVSETPWLVLLGWLSLRRRGLTWRALGLQRPVNWITTIAVALAAGVIVRFEPRLPSWHQRRAHEGAPPAGEEVADECDHKSSDDRVAAGAPWLRGMLRVGVPH